MRYLALLIALASGASAVEFSVPEVPRLSQPAAMAAPAAAPVAGVSALAALPVLAVPSAAPATQPQIPSAAAGLSGISGAVSNARTNPNDSLSAAFDGVGKLSGIEEQYRAPAGKRGRIDLSRIDPADTGGLTKKQALKKLAKDQDKLDERQQILYADGRRRVLIVLQGMDTGGKDGTIRHVMRSLNPQGVAVHSFKKPTPEEAAHPFLWRIQNALNGFGKGMIGIFNRSHYEDILVPGVINSLPAARVKELFGDPARIPQAEIEKRYDEINAFEKKLSEEGWTILKFFLYISKDEQKARLEERRDTPDKNWKLSSMDVKMRRVWPNFMAAYEKVLARTNTDWAPWYVIPANNKWYRDFLVGRIIKKTLKRLDLRYPSAEPGLKDIKIPD